MYFKSMTDQESQGRIGSGFFCMWKCNMSVPTPLKKPHFTPVDSLGEARKKTSQMPHLQRSRGQGGGTHACVCMRTRLQASSSNRVLRLVLDLLRARLVVAGRTAPWTLSWSPARAFSP